ncbi:hypothetical protein [Methanosphaera sp.]|jgi:hypothetical protein|uniref:hypothetical protein n=1 Tax=Methanosphaera sp. TaxID=2666342 RepID=UPI003D8C4AE6
MATTCNYDKNLVRLEIDGVTIGYVTEIEVNEEFEVSEEYYFGGVAVDSFKYPKTTITIHRLIRYNMTEESEVLRLLNCMRTDPKNITFVSQHTSMSGDGNNVGKLVQTYKNCRLSSHKRTLKPDEAFSQEIEFKSEGLINDDSNPVWSTVSN